MKIEGEGRGGRLGVLEKWKYGGKEEVGLGRRRGRGREVFEGRTKGREGADGEGGKRKGWEGERRKGEGWVEESEEGRESG